MSQQPGGRAERPVLHVICQAHIDPVWLWPWRDGFAEVLTTLQSAVDRLHEFPRMRYTCSSAAFYRWVEATDPRLFGEIAALVREGRWEVVGGWIVQADTLHPSEVSLRRQGRLGQQWLRDHLGVTATVGYCVDSFGHSAGLPSILRSEGMRAYVFQRPSPQEYGAVPNLFRWQAPDGAEVLAWRLATGYGQPAGLSPDRIEEDLRTRWRTVLSETLPVGTWFLGVGNHGGGPAHEHVRRLTELQEADHQELPEIRFSTLGEFFDDIERCARSADLPVVHGELLHHARGCYATNSRLKRLHRATERELLAAEALDRMRRGDGEPRDEPPPPLHEAWWSLCFNEFHDILPGTSVPVACDEAFEELGAARHAARRVAVESVHTMARRLDTTEATEGLIVLANPLPWQRTAVVKVDTFLAPHGDPITHLEAPDGSTAALQWTSADAGFGPHHAKWRKLVACVELPAAGTRWMHLAHGSPPRASRPTESATCSLRALADLAARAELVVVEDRADTWGHRVDRWAHVLGRASSASDEVLDDGPVFRRTRRRYEFGSSNVLLDTTQWPALEAVELVLHVTWRERYTALKLELPFDAPPARLVARSPAAAVERSLDGDEWFYGDWLAIMQDDSALIVVSDGCPAYDATAERLRLTLLRCVPYAHHDPSPHREDSPDPFIDEGYQRAVFWLTQAGPDGEITAGRPPQTIDRIAQGLLNPAWQMIDSAHPGAGGINA